MWNLVSSNPFVYCITILELTSFVLGPRENLKGLYTAAKEPSEMTNPSALLERENPYFAKSYPLLLATGCCEEPGLRMLLI